MHLFHCFICVWSLYANRFFGENVDGTHDVGIIVIVIFIILKVGVFIMSKKIRPFHLTPAEESVMNTLWNSGSAMPLIEVVNVAQKDSNVSWKPRSLFSIVNSLIAKGFIKEEGFVRSGKTYARTFAPAMSRPAFYANMVKDALSDEELATFKGIFTEI